MADDLFGGLIGAAGSLLGGYFSNQYNKKAAQTAFQQQFDAQNFFNTHVIQQKVQDAKAAGISPEFAMGAGTVSAPSMSAFSDSLGPAMASAGQNIGRAVTANMDANGRKLAELTVESADLDVQHKREELKRLRAAGTGPAASGQNDADRGTSAAPDEFQEQNPQFTEGKGKYVIGPFGIRVPRGRGMDAQSGEDIYGQLGELLIGTGNMIESGVMKVDEAHDYILKRVNPVIRREVSRVWGSIRDYLVRGRR